MKHRIVLAAVLVSLMVFATVAPAQEKGDKADRELPPCVVKTEPADRATDVDPALKVIKVTFNRKMEVNRSWSWIFHRRLGAYPGSRDLGEPTWENEGKTCVLPVRLRPNTLYAVGCNSFRHTGFRDRSGRIAVPHIWIFKTKPAAAD